MFHLVRHLHAEQERTGRRVGIGDERKQTGCDGDSDDAVHAVHEAAMAGNEIASVLEPEHALQRRLRQVARLRHHGQREPR